MRTLVAGARLHLGAYDLLSGGNTPRKRWSTCAERSLRLNRRTGLTMSQHAREITVTRSYAAGSSPTGFRPQGTASSPSAHQLLRGALAPEEIPAAAPSEETPPMLREDNSLVSSYVRTLTPGEMVLADRMTRAR
jgi:hypothetical protein